MLHPDPKNARIVGAWHALPGTRGTTGMLVVYLTDFGTAHAGDLRKVWRIPEDVVKDSGFVSKVAGTSLGEPSPKVSGCSFTLPKVHPLLTCDDDELAAAFERLLSEPSFSKANLTDWEFKLAADSPGVFAEYGRFTWKQRKYLRMIARKILEGG